MSRLHRTAAALAIVLSIALGAAANAQSAEPVKLAIGVDAAYVAIYLSKQDKLFEKHGVNVELVQFTQGGDALDAVAAGLMPMGGAAEPTTLISKDGRITSLDALNGDPLLVKAALDAVRQWRYRPTLLNGEPVEVETSITVIFRLRS